MTRRLKSGTTRRSEGEKTVRIHASRDMQKHSADEEDDRRTHKPQAHIFRTPAKVLRIRGERDKHLIHKQGRASRYNGAGITPVRQLLKQLFISNLALRSYYYGESA